MELTLEESQKQAEIIKLIQTLLQQLDTGYLQKCYDEMKKNHSFRESAMILNPNPLTAMEQQDLNAAKLKQLELYLSAAKNISKIQIAEAQLFNANIQSQMLGKMFGL